MGSNWLSWNGSAAAKLMVWVGAVDGRHVHQRAQAVARQHDQVADADVVAAAVIDVDAASDRGQGHDDARAVGGDRPQRHAVERAIGREHGDDVAADAVHLRTETRADGDGGNGRVDGKVRRHAGARCGLRRGGTGPA